MPVAFWLKHLALLPPVSLLKEGDSDSIVRVMTMPMEVMIRGMQLGDDSELLIQL